ncbi:D-alanyl-lipoteichoic acid acyltransferase DltB, MBOAT superfamily [Granulicella pectinivorans]|uniref:D-alanyl-lipoteichoic acid acyltransferase DltB, MBOAT superfamily n=1 Tax=Granulicella pectinivorans TaxID=474950 RepID=A0A1I6MCS3_9BACT|nr:MBOAT family O-acyltransferase [Granulicella pectinivorans]SFS13461.1 D-alanyl-lipoteichoic acid acyltransferase DltB, MBOAT superfamily [Granulicella pectinivorans]
MLFNSYPFIFIYLPLALLGFQIASHLHRKAVVVWLGFISLLFYGWWQPSLLIILVGSVAINYAAAAMISGRIPSGIKSKYWLTGAIVLNLLILGYYKYLIPAEDFFSNVFGHGKHWANLALPLGISFFTFTQIAFLVDLHKKSAEYQDFADYLLFVTFFPHLIAGPILHHREMMPQFKRSRFELNMADVTVGGTWFVLGLAKKVLIADTFAASATPMFLVQSPLSLKYAWIGALSYTLQLYFDFSGYSDMALGLARMFSIDFPLNFDSPYKSASIIEVWTRWHMTLGRYIFTYLYGPLTKLVREYRKKQGQGMSKKDRASVGTFVQVVALPLIVTMVLAGIWHGAGLQFMAFGLLHGVYLSINHAWRQFHGKPARIANHFLDGMRHGASVMLTFLCIVVSLVFFRASSVDHALSMLGGMAGIHGLSAPPATNWYDASDMHRAFPLIAIGLAIVWFLPNTQQILTHFKPSLQKTAWDQRGVPERLTWAPNRVWALVVGALFFVVLVKLQQPATFLYFQF